MLSQLKMIKLRRQRGFSLLEVLISVVILSIGLLGIAGLQLNGLRFAHNANLLYIASQQANDMADRMRANRAGVMARAYDNLDSGGTVPSCISTGCSASQMATADAAEWGSSLSQALPSGSGKVRGGGADSTFVITISWNEMRAGDDSIAVSYELNVRI